MLKKLYAFLLIPLLTGCYRVEQKIYSGNPTACEILCHNPECYVTYVWYDDDIAQSWYDNPDTLTDSIVTLRQKQADDFITLLKKSR